MTDTKLLENIIQVRGHKVKFWLDKKIPVNSELERRLTDLAKQRIEVKIADQSSGKLSWQDDDGCAHLTGGWEIIWTGIEKVSARLYSLHNTIANLDAQRGDTTKLTGELEGIAFTLDALDIELLEQFRTNFVVCCHKVEVWFEMRGMRLSSQLEDTLTKYAAEQAQEHIPLNHASGNLEWQDDGGTLLKGGWKISN